MIWETLPQKFTDRERKACRWLERVGVRGWLADLLKKTVNAQVGGEVRGFPSLVEFARFHGWEASQPPEESK